MFYSQEYVPPVCSVKLWLHLSCYVRTMQVMDNGHFHVHPQSFPWFTNRMLKALFLKVQCSVSWHPLILVSLQAADVCGECFCTHLLIVMNYVYIVLYHSLQDGNTPLILASQEGHKDIVEVLLNHGAEVDLPDMVSVCVSLPWELMDIYHVLCRA